MSDSSKFSALDAIPYAGPALKSLFGLYQLTQHVDRTDTTTAAEREQLALARQAQTSRLPGFGVYQARLNQTQSAATQAAARGAGSGSDYLAAASAADRVRTAGEGQLNAQDQQNHIRANGQLSQVLGAYARHQQADTDRANQANAQLTGSAITNLFGGLTDAGSVAAYQGSQSKAPTGAGDYGTPGYTPDFGPALMRSIYPSGDYPRLRRVGPYGYAA